MKFLLWGLIAVMVIVWLTRGKKASSDMNRTDRSASTRDKIGETMVQCAHCGTYIPASESVTAPSGAAFCSEEHRLRHAKS